MNTFIPPSPAATSRFECVVQRVPRHRSAGDLRPSISGFLVLFLGMSSESVRRHVFISHHHRDDAHVSKLTDLLSRNGYDIRNSSIRAKPANQRRLEKGLVSERTIQRLLRMKISWASTVVVLIGKETHARPWVNWEIEKANQLGKRIVGVFTHGGTNADIPPAFKKYGCDLRPWNADSIMEAIDGKENVFQNADGTPCEPFAPRTTSVC